MEENKNIKQYTAVDIQNYVEGRSSAAEMHAIEKAALDDPFLADAIEGMENNIKKRGSGPVNADITDLQKRLSDRINAKRKTSVIVFNHLWWRVAAALIVLIGVGTLTYIYFAKSTFSNENIAQSKTKRTVMDTIVKKDTSIVRSKPQTSNAVVVVHERKEEQKTRSATAKSNVAPNEKAPDTIAEDKNALSSASISKPNASSVIENKRYQTDSGEVFQEAKKRAVVKDIESFATSNNANEFVGKVVDLNSRPISGAYVIIANQKKATVTDNKGMFKLFAPKADSTVKITVSSVGFETAKAILINDNDIANNTINLRSSSSSLSEVVVAGSRAKRKTDVKNIASEETLKNAEPVIGWKKYKEYVDKNKRLSGDSIGLRIIEVVSFSIKKNGKLSNFNIEQSYNDDFDDEAIRLIKNGPAWKLLKNKKARATLTIEF